MSDFIKDWDAIKKILKETLGADSYYRFIAELVPLELKDGVCRLGISNETFADWLMDNYLNDIRSAIEKVTGVSSVKVIFEDGHAPDMNLSSEASKEAVNKSDKKSPDDKLKKAKVAPKVTPKRTTGSEDTVDSSTILNPHYTFDNFVVGDSNEYCHAACMAVAKAPGTDYNPLFIHGDVGLGKTHLAQGIAHQVRENKKRAKIECLTSEEFLNIYVEAMSKKKLPSFRRHFRSLDLLVIDDVQFFAGKEKFQEEFFHTFNTLYNAHKQVVLTSDKAPHELDGLEKRMVSRFEWGLSTEVCTPGLETRVAILKQKQETQRIKVKDEILFYIAERITTNIRRLEGALKKLISYVSLTKEDISIPLVNKLLGAIFEEEVSGEITVEQIQRSVAEYFDIRVSDITGKKRLASIVGPRQVAMFLCRKLTKLSTPEIGELFGRNHATILHAVQKVEKDIDKDEKMKHTIGRLERQLNAAH